MLQKKVEIYIKCTKNETERAFFFSESIYRDGSVLADQGVSMLECKGRLFYEESLQIFRGKREKCSLVFLPEDKIN